MKTLPQRWSRTFDVLNESEWEFPEWYKKIKYTQLFEQGYHKCECGTLIGLHRQACSLDCCGKAMFIHG